MQHLSRTAAPETSTSAQRRPVLGDAPISGPDHVDLRDLSTSISETCAALSLCLRDGDLFAAERLLGFLLELQPDRRLFLADVLQPLVRHELRSLTSQERRATFVTTCRDLLVRQRSRMTATERAGVLLCAQRDDEQALYLQMVTLLLDEVGVPAHILQGADESGIVRTVEMRGDGAVCLPAARAADHVELIRGLRRRRVAVVLAGDATPDPQTVSTRVGASAGVASVSAAADLLLYLRGPLTAAEASALRLAADGYTNVRMAHELGISVSAVKARLEGSYLKLHAADRTHAVAIALRERWIR